MHHIRTQHFEKIKAKGMQPIGEGILEIPSNQYRLLDNRRKHTTVGTNDISRSMFSTPALFTRKFFSYMTFRAASIRLRRRILSSRAIVSRCLISLAIPRFWTRSIVIRQRGHGHRPRLRIVAIRILIIGCCECNIDVRDGVLLFGVVC